MHLGRGCGGPPRKKASTRLLTRFNAVFYTRKSVAEANLQLASEIICLNRRDRTSQGGLVGSWDVGISRMQSLDTYRGDVASLYLHPHLVQGADDPNKNTAGTLDNMPLASSLIN